MLKRLLTIGALVVLTVSMFLVQSMRGTAYAAIAKACTTSACAVTGAFDGFAFAFAKAWGTLASAFAG